MTCVLPAKPVIQQRIEIVLQQTITGRSKEKELRGKERVVM
jgi:hypothetical protein